MTHLSALPLFRLRGLGYLFPLLLLLFTSSMILFGAGVQNLGLHLESWIASGDGFVLLD